MTKVKKVEVKRLESELRGVDREIRQLEREKEAIEEEELYQLEEGKHAKRGKKRMLKEDEEETYGHEGKKVVV